MDEERMKQNIGLTQGRCMSEAVMITLAERGMGRQEAHEHLRALTIKSETEEQPFKEVLLEDKQVCKLLSEREINNALDPRNYLGTAVKQVERMVKKTMNERKARGLHQSHGYP
jgi:adenylosuccinate lyase